MSLELRPLGIAHGLLLGGVVAAPAFAPDLMPMGTQALFLMGGFQLRLADRRWQARARAADWISHIRMAPQRILPWAALCLSAFIAGQREVAVMIAAASLLCEALLYPLSAPGFGGLSRRNVGVLTIVAVASAAIAGPNLIGFSLAFLSGTAACLFWLRGPDGDAVAFAQTLIAAAAAGVVGWLLPPLASTAMITVAASLTLALAQLGTMRRRPAPWRSGGAIRFKPRRLRPKPAPSSAPR